MKTTTFKYTVTYEVDEWSKAMDLERSIAATLKTFNDENGNVIRGAVFGLNDD